MSNTITATVHSDAELAAIRDMVATKNDGIPFILLPVKVETRFMTVDVPIYTNDTFPWLIEDLYLAADEVLFDPGIYAANDVLQQVEAINVRLEAIATKSTQILRFNGEEKHLLHLKTQALFVGGTQLLSRLEQLSWSDADARATLRLQRTTLSAQLSRLNGSMEKLVPTQAMGDGQTAAFIGSLQGLHETMGLMSRQPFATKDRKLKRAVFETTESHFANLKKDLQAARLQMASNMTASGDEMKQIQGLLGSLGEQLRNATTGFDAIDSAYKQAEYASSVKGLEAHIAQLQEEMATRLAPKLSIKSELRTVDTRTLLRDVHDTRSWLRRGNARPFRDYKEVKATRVQLYEKLHALRTNLHKVMEGDHEDMAALRAAWDATDAELVTFTQRVKRLKATSRAEKAGLSRTVTHINKEYRRDLAGLKTDAKSSFPLLTNQVLEESNAVYKSAMASLGELHASIQLHLDQRGASEELQAKMAEVVALNTKLNVDFRSLHILPEARFNELQGLSAALHESVVKAEGQIAASIEGSLANAGQAASASIFANVQAQVSDALDRKDRFYDEFRPGLVFSPKTTTEKQLWVRIFPDDIAVHTHEAALTQAEVDSAKAYWYEIWAAGTDEDLRLAAWRAISASYGSQRAAWIVRALDPGTLTEASAAAFYGISGEIIGINSLLVTTNGLLQNGIDKGINPFTVLGDVFPYLRSAAEQLGKVTAANETLLTKSRRLLLKSQSLLGRYFGAIGGLPEKDLQQLGAQIQIANTVKADFGNAVAGFKSILPERTSILIHNPSLEPVFPTVTIKDGSWTEAPHSRVMPDRFVAIAVRGGQYRYVEVGRQLPADRLIVGLDPDDFDSNTFSYDADGNLIVDPNIKWLTDFPTALNMGMAISFKIDQSDWDQGFDKLIVLGVKDRSASTGRTLLQDLIDNHHYIPEGASFLPIGTPTNNTESGQSGYRTFEDDAALSFEIERRSERGVADVSDPQYPKDYERLADALGITRSRLQHFDYSLNTEVSDALLMNKALFPGTVGGYMEDGLDTLFTVDNIQRSRDFMVKYVSARGYLPSIRIGTQPYGILPTSALSYFECTQDDSVLPQLSKADFEDVGAIESELQIRFDVRLKNLLRFANSLFTNIRTAPGTKVKYVGNLDPMNPQGEFMEMLGLHATSVERYYRYGLNVAARQGASAIVNTNVKFEAVDPYGPALTASAFRDLILTGYYLQSDNFPDEFDATLTAAQRYALRTQRIANQFQDMRIFAMRSLQNHEQLLGETIDHRELSDTVQSPAALTGDPVQDMVTQSELEHYIDWITTHNPYTVHAHNHFAEVDGNAIAAGQPGKSLLFQLLRHSMLTAYGDTVLSILEKEGLINQKIRRKMGQARYYYSRFNAGEGEVTKWTFLFSKLNYLTNVLGANMDPHNAFFVYMISRPSLNDQYLNRFVSPEHAYLYNGYPNHANHDPFMAKLQDTRNAIQQLKAIPTAKLDKLLAEHLDLCSYRLDAWYLGLANQRLSKQRAVHGTGIYIGAYGYVEELRRGGALAPAQNIPSGLWKNGDAPVYTDADNLGFIHTPSLNHAVAAAVLRAGFHSNEATSEVDNQMAVNLSSERVRMALNLLHGIKGGQETGALLGYQFERGLHERYAPLELDAFIYDFRDEFPLSIAVETADPADKSQRANVVNGMELMEYAQSFIHSLNLPASGDSLYQSLTAHAAAWWTHLGISTLQQPGIAAEQDAILKEIDRMANAFDALGDLCVSESIYQMAKGNHVRASSILDQLAKGDVPAEIEITDTPRTGTVVTQKVALFLERIPALDHALTNAGPLSTPLAGADIEAAVNAALARPLGWNAPFGPRALLEPSLNKWAGEMIGDPSHIKCLVDYEIVESAQVTTVGTVVVSLADLSLQALDILYLFGTGALIGGAELNTRIAVFARTQLPPLPLGFTGTTDDVALTLRFTEREPSWTDADFSFYEKAGLIQSVRVLATSSSVLAADHLHIPGEQIVPENEVRNQNLPELLIRVTNARARLKACYDAMTSFFTNEVHPEQATSHVYTNAQVDALRTLLRAAADFGLPSCLPELAVSYGDAVGRVLMTSALGAYKGIADRLGRAAADITKANDTALPNDPRVDALIEASRSLMGPAFKIFPHFTIRNASELTGQLNLSHSAGLLRAAAPQAMDAWSQGLGRVRERMSQLDSLQMLADNFERAMPAMQPLQLPFALTGGGIAVDHWLGLPYPVGYAPTEDKLSIAVMNANAILTNPADTKVALLVDEWVEIIPNRQETTGLTFNYDQPDAKAPNAILLAVTPKETGHWVWDDLVHTIEDTVELSKNRAVEPEHLENSIFGQILPGILMEIVPPSVSGLEFTSDDNPLGMQVVTDFKYNNATAPQD